MKHRQLATLLGALLAGTAALPAWCAPAGGKGDTTPPSTIAPVSAVHPRAFAIGVDFAAVGDDGTSGTATSYDVYWRPASGSCAAPPADLAGWTRSERSNLVIPQAAGASESIPVRPLQPGNDYCIALRARDEAGLASPSWRVVSSATVNLPWTLVESAIPQNGTTPRFINTLRVTTDGYGLAQLAWTELESSQSSTIQGVGFATAPTDASGIQFDGPYFPIRSYIDGFSESYAARRPDAVPASGDVSLLVLGRAPATATKQAIQNRLLLLERSGASVTQTVVVTGANESGGFTDSQSTPSLAYVPDGNGGYRAAVTFERINVRSRSLLDSVLTLRERSGAGWVDTELLRRITPLSSTNNFNNFAAVNEVVSGNGDAHVLATACGRTILMRRPAGTNAWQYFDAGPASASPSFFVAAAAPSGDVLAVRGGGTWTEFARLAVGANSVRALPGKPEATCGASWSNPDDPAPVWEAVDLADGGLNFAQLRGVAESPSGAVQLLFYLGGTSTAGNSGFLPEGRLATRCAAGNWEVEKLDRGVRPGHGAVLDGTGNALYVAAWGPPNPIRQRTPTSDRISLGARSGAPVCSAGSTP